MRTMNMHIQFCKDGQDITEDMYASADATEVRAWTDDSTCLGAVTLQDDGRWKTSACDVTYWAEITESFDSWRDGLTALGVTSPVAHTFMTSGDAYDCSQCDVNIHDGDVLHVPSEGSAAVLYRAWPVAVNPDYDVDADGAFHVMTLDETLDTIDGGIYAESMRVALALIDNDDAENDE